MDKRISVTELDIWQDCQVRWDLGHRRRLEPVEREEEEEESRLMFGSRMATYLEYALAGQDGMEAQVLKWGKLSVKALLKFVRSVESIPPWVLKASRPVAEDKLVQRYKDVTLVGKPDLWFVQSGEEGTEIRLVEFKTCGDYRPKAEEKLRAYEQWGVQVLRYAFLLRDAYPEFQYIPLYRQHILISSHGFTLEGGVIPVPEQQTDMIREETLRLAGQVGKEEPVHNYRHSYCPRFCPFSPVCLAGLTGGDPEDVISEGFQALTPQKPSATI